MRKYLTKRIPCKLCFVMLATINIRFAQVKNVCDNEVRNIMINYYP